MKRVTVEAVHTHTHTHNTFINNKRDTEYCASKNIYLKNDG